MERSTIFLWANQLFRLGHVPWFFVCLPGRVPVCENPAMFHQVTAAPSSTKEPLWRLRKMCSKSFWSSRTWCGSNMVWQRGTCTCTSIPHIHSYIYVYMIINMYVGVFLHTSVFIVIQSLLLLLFLLLLSHIIITYYYHVLSCLLIISSPKSFYPNLQGWNIAHMVLLDSIHLCQMKK